MSTYTQLEEVASVVRNVGFTMEEAAEAAQILGKSIRDHVLDKRQRRRAKRIYKKISRGDKNRLLSNKEFEKQKKYFENKILSQFGLSKIILREGV